MLAEMKKFEKRKLHDHIDIVKEMPYSFMLVLRDEKGKQIGDITIYTDYNTHVVKTISVAFLPEISIKISKPAWNGVLIHVIRKSDDEVIAWSIYQCAVCGLQFKAMPFKSYRKATGRTVTHCGEPAIWLQNAFEYQGNLFYCKNGELVCSPINSDGTVDWENEYVPELDTKHIGITEEEIENIKKIAEQLNCQTP